MQADIAKIVEELEAVGYVADRAIATAVHLGLAMEKPLLVEGAAGVGKTEIAKAVALWLEAELIRLQCYEGLDLPTALYEWNYQKQLLHIRLQGGDGDAETVERTIFGPDFLLERPLLRAIRCETRPVLLIDEVDRADEEFEAFLLELLSDFQVSIPELGTVEARTRPRRRAHIERDARAVRRASAALPLSVDRLSRSGAGGRDPAAATPGHRRRTGARGREAGAAAAPRAARQAPRRRRDARFRIGSGAPGTGAVAAGDGARRDRSAREGPERPGRAHGGATGRTARVLGDGGS